ncbi:MAG: hypothetical protein C0501_22935 [Isosphaera sp.]|nr:hypothetical protein [Isosphaera sp.]
MTAADFSRAALFSPVTETADDPYVAKLIRAHAAVVTKFIETGHDEVRNNHPLPEKSTPKKP